MKEKLYLIKSIVLTTVIGVLIALWLTGILGELFHPRSMWY